MSDIAVTFSDSLSLSDATNSTSPQVLSFGDYVIFSDRVEFFKTYFLILSDDYSLSSSAGTFLGPTVPPFLALSSSFGDSIDIADLENLVVTSDIANYLRRYLNDVI